MAPLVLKALGTWWYGGGTMDFGWTDQEQHPPSAAVVLLSVRQQWPDLMPGVGHHAQLAMGPVGLSLGWCCPPLRLITAVAAMKPPRLAAALESRTRSP